MGKTFQELDLKSAFLFAAALEDNEICRLVLELILGQPISKLNAHAEHSLLYNSDFRSLRLDIYAGDEMRLEYNLEMQNEDEGAKKIFLSTRGTNQEEVPEALVNFLKYVEQSTEEVASASRDDRIQKLHNRIRILKADRTWEARYMKFEELLQKSENKGREEGRDETLELVNLMTADGRTEEIKRLKSEPEFFEEMLEYYKLKTV